MGLPGTSSRRRRWLKSVVVLVIGLSYLAVVYWASPALRDELRWKSVWYGWPWELPKRVYYRVGGDLRLRGFEKRLVKAAEKTERVRLTLEVTRRWRVEKILDDDDPHTRQTELSDVRERRCIATLVLDRVSSPDAFGSEERFKLLVEGDDRWSAWVHDGTHGWHLLTLRWAGHTEEIRRQLGWGTTWPPQLDVYDPIVRQKMIPLWAFVCPNAFDNLLRATDVSRDGEAEFNGQPCRIIRIERRWQKALPEVCRLWMPVGEDRVVKVEYTPAWSPDFVERLTDAELAELGTVCIVTSYEEPESFEAAEFDPVPLLERWAADTARAVQEDIEQLEEQAEPRWGPSGGFGAGLNDSTNRLDRDEGQEDGTE